MKHIGMPVAGFSRARLHLAAAAFALACAAGVAAPAQAQYIPGAGGGAGYYYPQTPYYPPTDHVPPQRYYPQAQPDYYPHAQPDYYPDDRVSRRPRYGVANHCATQFGTCEIGPTRLGRVCNCFYAGYGKVPGQAVQ